MKDERSMLEKQLLNKYAELDENVIFAIIPELKASKGFKHNHPHHCYDVWNHTRAALFRSSKDLEIRLALLLHDIGKPFSYQDGEVRYFKGHPEKSAQMSRTILERIGYDKDEINTICFLVENHDTLIDINRVNERNLALTKKMLEIQYCDAFAHAPQHILKRINKLNEVRKQIEKFEKERTQDKVPEER